MKKDVIISIFGKQSTDGPPVDSATLVTEGRYYRQGGQYYLCYEDSSLTGFERTRTTVKVGSNLVTIMRAGQYPSQMMFERGVRHHALYHTDYGDLTIGITTKSIRSCLNDSGGHLHIVYDVEIEHAHAATNEISIRVSENTKKGRSLKQ